MNPPKIIIHAMLCILVSQLFACSTAPARMEYEVNPETAAVWPLPPEVPRYRYVGTLYGEQNFIKDESQTNIFVEFFEWLVGISGAKQYNPLILQRPNSGMVDDLGRILVTDISRHSVIVFDETNAKITEWQLAESESALKTPIGIVQGDNNTYYVSDADLQLVVKLDKEGNPLSSFGHDILLRPTGIARDPEHKQIYVADTKAHNIKVFSDDGQLLDVIGSWGTKIGEFNAPTHIFFAKDRLYVTDTFNSRVQILDASGEYMSNFGQRGLYVGDLVRPKGVTVDSEGNIYVIESFHDYLLVYNGDGQLLIPVGGTGTEVGQFYLPSGVWADKNNKIYVADMFNGRIVILQYLGATNNTADTSLSN